MTRVPASIRERRRAWRPNHRRSSGVHLMRRRSVRLRWPELQHMRSIRALLTDPWVFGSAWQGGSVSAEGEHGQSDECFGGAESERNPGQESDFGVGGFDQSLG